MSSAAVTSTLALQALLVKEGLGWLVAPDPILFHRY